MDEIQIVIVFFAFLFAGSLFYSAKKKSESLFSFALNLELEYIIVGLALYYMAGSMTIPVSLLNGIMHLLLVFIGLALGTHFSIKLLMNVPKHFYLFSLIVYFTLIPLVYIVLVHMGCSRPAIMSIVLNTLMPYSLNLSMKLFRVPKERLFISSLAASLFPLFTLIAYSVAAGAVDYRPVDFVMSLGGSLLLTFFFLHYGKSKSKKNLHKISILFVVMISGISMYFEISPIVLGFLTGFITSDTKYGNIFQNISISFERMLYIFFYVALGVMLGFGYSFSGTTFSTALAIFFCFVIVRYIIAKVLADWIFPTKGEVICLISTGILPAVLLMDFGTRFGYLNISKLFMPFFLLHIATEITTYFMMKYERKNN